MKLPLLLLLSIITKQCLGDCTHSYHTICESVEDFEKLNDGTWTDVTIKSDQSQNVKSTPFTVAKFRDLNSLTIVGQVSELIDSENTCVYEVRLTSLNLFDNSIKTIEEGNFVRFLRLNKLGLVNNSIQVVKNGAFRNPKIEVIDLSFNKIGVIENGTFTRDPLQSSTKIIILSHNKLKVVEANSFPNTLQILKLDHNDLTSLEEGVVDGMVYLQALYLSKNKLNSLPNVKNLHNLRILDASHNSVKFVDSKLLENLRFLEILDLSHNKISTVAFLRPLLLKNGHLAISLTFNLLQNLDSLDVPSNVTLNNKFLDFYGNPWLCKEWESVEKFTKEINLLRSGCDSEYFDKVPFCVDSYSKKSEGQVQDFEYALNDKKLNCDSFLKTHTNLLTKGRSEIHCNHG